MTKIGIFTVEDLGRVVTCDINGNPMVVYRTRLTLPGSNGFWFSNSDTDERLINCAKDPKGMRFEEDALHAVGFELILRERGVVT